MYLHPIPIKYCYLRNFIKYLFCQGSREATKWKTIKNFTVYEQLILIIICLLCNQIQFPKRGFIFYRLFDQEKFILVKQDFIFIYNNDDEYFDEF